jgi:competence ComEA-like helix-hairpin-helix protein
VEDETLTEITPTQVEVESVSKIEEPVAAQIDAAEVEEPELPEWLAESEEEVPEEEWTPPVEPVKAALREPRHGTAPLTQPPTEPVNVNKASLVDLETLPGVGFILAQNILTYREAFGQYAAVDDLIKVPGITPSILAEIREYLTVPPGRQCPQRSNPRFLLKLNPS